MNILVFNCGSSSQAFKVYRVAEGHSPEVMISGKAKNVATPTQSEASLSWQATGENWQKPIQAPSHGAVAEIILQALAEAQVKIDAVGHRFVHGGAEFRQTTRIDPQSLERLRRCFPLAPIHNPNAYQVIETCQRQLPGVAQYVVFDTAFHANLPPAARHYALPGELVTRFGFQKYGFHGLSYQFVSARAAAWFGFPPRLVICHLGTGGASLAAIQNGHSVDTSMGYSPLAGLVMSTRCGDLDAEIVLELMRQGWTADQISHLLNDQSGLLGLSGFSSNLEEIIAAAEQGHADCQLAYDVYVQRLKHYLGAYIWLLNGADALVFTDDIGLHSWKLRERVCSGAENLGLSMDRRANCAAAADRISAVHAPASKIQILLIPTDEELIIVEELLKLHGGET